LGHAIWTAKELIGDEPFAVMLGDDVIDSKTPALKQLIKVFDKYQDIVVGVTKVAKKDTGKYGIIDPVPIDENTVEIKRFIEKPSPAKAPSNLAVTGRYVLTSEIFDYLGKQKKGAGGEIQLTDAIAKYIKKRAGYACIYKGDYYDCGNKLEYVKAIVNYTLKRKDFRAPLKKYLKNL
jgi:UTP--glucose-1-phosphate uridylyltransferase